MNETSGILEVKCEYIPVTTSAILIKNTGWISFHGGKLKQRVKNFQVKHLLSSCSKENKKKTKDEGKDSRCTSRWGASSGNVGKLHRTEQTLIAFVAGGAVEGEG